jgi:hypothetical protein
MLIRSSQLHLVVPGATIAALVAVVGSARVRAQFATAPTTYTVTETNAMMGSPETMTTYRNGSKAVVDITHPGQPGGTRTLYDLQAHTARSWSVPDSSGGCSGATFSGDWGDPFAGSTDMAAQLAKQNAKALGPETVNGFATTMYEVSAGGQSMKAWVDTKYGFVVKLQSGQGATLVEVKSLSVDAPAASLFAVPATCGAASGPAAPSEADRIAAETGGNAANYANAIMPSAQDSGAVCAATLKVVRAGTMAPIATGFQVGLDLDQNATGGYHVGTSASGTAQFSGGAIKEVTTQLRSGALLIPSAPKHFYLDVEFGNAGSASAVIYRQCPGPQGTLYLVVKNPQKLADGADWLWSKTGK